MKILYIDSPSIQNSIRIALMGQMTNHEVCLIDSEERAIEYFMNETPEVVIYEPSVPLSVDILEKILFINPMQKCVSLSDAVDCADIEGCDVCFSQHNRKAVKKEQGLHALLYLIDNFAEMACEFASNKISPATT